MENKPKLTPVYRTLAIGLAAPIGNPTGVPMSDLPKFVTIQEEGPREGFQIERGPIAVADKVRFIEALAETGLKKIDCVSWVNPARVPGMADAEEVAP